MKIKIFVVKLGSGRLQTNTRGHLERYTTHGGMEATMYGMMIDDPALFERNCKRAVIIVRDFAEKHGIRYKVYDVQDDWPSFLAWIARIKVLPTVIIGKRRVEGVPSLDDLYEGSGIKP